MLDNAGDTKQSYLRPSVTVNTVVGLTVDLVSFYNDLIAFIIPLNSYYSGQEC